MVATEGTHLSAVVPLSFSSLINGWSIRRLVLPFKISSVGASITNRSEAGSGHRRGLVGGFNMAPVFVSYHSMPIHTESNCRDS